MTETFGQVATLKPGAPVRRRAHPLPGVELRIAEDGRIAVRGAQVSPGYLGEPDREAEWLVTNDLGALDTDGALRVLGRADTVIVTGGENVDPARVESELVALPGVDEAIVVGIPDETWGELLAALYAGPATPDSLQSLLASHLPRYMVPSRWRVVGEIPRTGLGKPDRAAAVRLLSVQRA